MSSSRLLAIILLCWCGTARAQISLRPVNGTNSGTATAATNYNISLPTGVQNGDLIVICVASTNQNALSSTGYTAANLSGFSTFLISEFRGTFHTGDSTTPNFDRGVNAGSDAYTVAAFINGLKLDQNTAATTSAASTTITFTTVTPQRQHELVVFCGGDGGNASYSALSLGTIAVQQASAAVSAMMGYTVLQGGQLIAIPAQTATTSASLVNGGITDTYTGTLNLLWNGTWLN